MKAVFTLIIGAVLLSGCASVNFDYQKELNVIKQHTEDFATGGGDIDKFRKDIAEFNDKLENLRADDGKLAKFAEIQRKANELRLEGMEENNYEKINESTAYQAQALEIYHEINN